MVVNNWSSDAIIQMHRRSLMMIKRMIMMMLMMKKKDTMSIVQEEEEEEVDASLPNQLRTVADHIEDLQEVMMMISDMIFVKSYTQAYTLTFRNLPEENA